MPEGVRSVYVFVSERLAPLSVAGYQRMVARAGEAAGFPFLVHSHMLRHSCGYKLAKDGQDTRAIQHYLGHRSITERGKIVLCPLSGVKRTSRFRAEMSANDPKRTCNWRRTGISPMPRFERPIWDSAPCFSLIAKAFSLAWNKIRLPAFGHR